MRKTKALKNNLHRWRELLYSTEGTFLTDLYLIQEEFNLPIEKFGNYAIIASSKGFKIADSVKDKAYNTRIKFLNKLKENGKFDNFIQDVVKLLDNYNLGVGWLTCILDMLITLFEMPPRHNLLYYKKGDTIIIELHPNTSFNDLTEAWQDIGEELKKIKPLDKQKRLQYSKEKINNMDLLHKDWLQRSEEDHKKSKNQNQDYHLTDLDRIGLILPEEEIQDISIEADKKRVKRLRTARSRSRKNYRN